MDNQTIREIIEAIYRGQIRIPAFQRGFVWEPERVAYLIDSIYKGYPFGSLMFWRTKEQLKFDRDLGPFEIPEPKEDYPVDYVLDGQQRVTSLFGVLQTELKPKENEDWEDIYFDFSAPHAVQDTQFLALKADQVDTQKHFPMRTLFDTVAYRAATDKLDVGAKKIIDDMQTTFKEARIPVQITKTEDKGTVAIIFERINRQGVALDTLQLLTAWTWSEEFQLSEQFEELANELKPFGFSDVGGNTDLLLRCTSAVLSADASPSALMQLNGQVVRERFEEVTNGVKHAIDYLRNQLHVFSLKNLPFETMLVPLSVFFATSGNKERGFTADEARAINRWFWRSAFSKRYSAAVIRNLKSDIDAMINLRNKQASSLGNFQVKIDPDFFLRSNFVLSNVNTKSHILALSTLLPRSFVSGGRVDLEATLKAANRSEFHHMMPKSFVKKLDVESDVSVNCLANICFLSRSDNRTLGGTAPSEYQSKMPKEAATLREILNSAAAPHALFDDDFDKFVEARAVILAQHANSLCQNAEHAPLAA